MFYGSVWFGLNWDDGFIWSFFAWLLFGLAVAAASGLMVRWAINRVIRVDPSGY